MAHRDDQPGRGDFPGHARHVDGHLAAKTHRRDGPPARRPAPVFVARLHRVMPGVRATRARLACAGTKTEANVDRRHRAARRADRTWRLDQCELRRTRLRNGLSSVPRRVVAANRFQRSLCAVARHWRELRGWRSRWRSTQRDPDDPSDRRWGRIAACRCSCRVGMAPRIGFLIGALLVAQIVLGISNVVLGLPLAVATAHTAVAALLLLSLIAALACMQAAPVAIAQREDAIEYPLHVEVEVLLEVY